MTTLMMAKQRARAWTLSKAAKEGGRCFPCADRRSCREEEEKDLLGSLHDQTQAYQESRLASDLDAEEWVTTASARTPCRTRQNSDRRLAE